MTCVMPDANVDDFSNKQPCIFDCHVLGINPRSRGLAAMQKSAYYHHSSLHFFFGLNVNETIRIRRTRIKRRRENRDRRKMIILFSCDV